MRCRALVGALALACGAAACGGSSHRARSDSATTVTVAPASTTTPAPTVAPTTTTAQLPVRENAPSNPRENVPVVAIGTVVIPAIGLRHTVYQGIWLTVIDHGPGHWPGTAMPGQLGNAVFPGHRVTHSHPFIDLDRLHPGDEIRMEMHYGTFTYRVRDTVIVRPTDMWVTDQHQRGELTLIACHPKHSARQRIVVRADLVGAPIVPPAGAEPEVHA